MANHTYSDLQVVPSGYSDLQVVPGGGLEAVQEEKIPRETERTTNNPSLSASTQSRICGLKPKTFWIAFVVLLVVLAGALGGGVGGGLSASDNNHKQEEIATSTSSLARTTDSKTSSDLPIASTPVVTSDLSPTLTTRTVILPTATLLRDCPSSNNTLYDVKYGSEEPLIFRKFCVAGLRHDINGLDILNEPTKSLNECINACADYNNKNKTQIATGDSQVCNAVCWRSDEELSNINQIPGQCFAFTTMNTTAGMQVTNETLCDSAIWINQRNL